MRRAVAAVAIVIGCGDNIQPSVELAELRAERTSAECERYVRCGLVADHATCVAYFRQRPIDSLLAAIAAGIVSYDGVAARRCFDALAKLSCDATTREVRIEPPECGAIFVGTRTANEECALDEECVSGECTTPTCLPDMCCPGVCAGALTEVALGDACGSDTVCSADAFCGDDGVCRSLAGVGQPCRNEAHCEFGLGCIGATELQAGACRALPHIGESCPYQRCAEIGLRCNGAFVCEAFGLPGNTCTDDSNCSSFSPCESSTCVATPGLGMPCTRTCGGESWCNGTECVELLQPNEPCGANNECASLYCSEGPIFDFCAERAVCY